VAYPSGLLMKSFQLPFATLSEIVLQDLSSGKSVAISGLSNTGKSTFMRGLSSA
jgi:ABC-type phosphate/phosphonate transport system ATPase subunit